ncbi:DUF4333 domain-containing protein [Actinomadura parmotrematis]|uniref:DUF4333 domain-containing protein n=1 Tax=Actinomadura parmotrematis TaxID=2864039 RepID=A0ABS7FSD3_9ACTN|nr:DUF4333 domain-containing protein [Actinomadura parmotrematis]MBW8483320.1 DUF4333 domain-containing protein [Actinomadura parmotrematis]
MRKFLVVPALLGAAAFAAAGCQIGDKTVSHDKVEQQINAKLGLSASCPDDLKGKVGASVTCTAGNRTVTVTVTSVEGDTVKFDMKAA